MSIRLRRFLVRKTLSVPSLGFGIGMEMKGFSMRFISKTQMAEVLDADAFEYFQKKKEFSIKKWQQNSRKTCSPKAEQNTR